MRPSTGRSVARSDERKRDTVPTPRFARRPSTRYSLSPAEGGCPQNYMVDQQKTADLGGLFVTDFPHLQRFHVGGQDSKPKEMVVPVLPRRQRHGLKKWRWSIRWTI